MEGALDDGGYHVTYTGGFKDIAPKNVKRPMPTPAVEIKKLKFGARVL